MSTLGSALTIFNYGASQVRTVMINGEPWFVVKDVMHILGLSNITETLNRLDADEFSSTKVIDSIGRNQRTYVVNEEVLPTIRKTGSYSIAPQPQFHIPTTLAEALRLAADKEEEAQRLALERDEAVRTKAHISDKKTASAMGTASGAVRRANAAEKEDIQLENQLSINGDYLAAAA